VPKLRDEEFGEITVRRVATASQVKISLGPDGKLRASLPAYAPLFLVKRLLNSSREELRKIFASATPKITYSDGMTIGKKHTLIARPGSSLHIVRQGTKIMVTLPDGKTLNDASVVKKLREEITEALRREAKEYLPKRLHYLSTGAGLFYTKVRFSHASSRWGSCSSSGTISLNIALMKLPLEIIDYVLIHELAHTRQMNHSEKFWKIVAEYDSKYKIHRKYLKTQDPTI